jgi:O-antigen/teichoic acid export membrane protein
MPSPPETQGGVPSSYASLPFGDLVRRVGVTASIYTIGTLIVRFGEFLLIPIYWRLLSPEDYGTLAVTTIVTTFLSGSLGLALQQSITRFYYVWPADERRLHLGSVWMLDWTSSLSLGAAIALFGGPVFDLLIRRVPFDPFLRLAVWIAMFNSLTLSPLMTLRILEQARLYVFCSALTFLSNALGTILLVAGLQRGVLGVLQAQLGTGILMTAVYTLVMLRRARPNFRSSYWREPLRFSLPLVPASLTESLSSITDRLVLEKFISLTDLGYYSVADSLGRAVGVLNRSLKTTWIPFAMRTTTERSNGREEVGSMATYFGLPILLAALSLAVLSHDLVTLIGVEKYMPVVGLVHIAVLPYVILGYTTLVGQGLLLAYKTEYSWIVTLTYLVVSLVGNVLLVPIWGIYGAFAANIGATFARAAMVYILSQRFYPIPFRWPTILLMMLGAVIVWGVSQLLVLDSSLIGLLVRGGLVAIYAGLAIYLLHGG